MKIKIIQLSSSSMWYRNKIGQILNVERIDNEYFWCREDAGYINIVHRSDAEIIKEGETNDNNN